MAIGLIGGSGLAQGLERIIQGVERHELDWPQCTIPFYTGTMHGTDVVIVPRHGDSSTGKPQLTPAKLTERKGYHAIAWLFREQGVSEAYGFSAIGSIDTDLPIANEGVFAIPSTYGMGPGGVRHSFGSDADIPHTNMRTPFDTRLRMRLFQAVCDAGYQAVLNGIYIYTGGDAFETPEEVIASGIMYPGPKPRLLGMTTVPELQLLAQLGIPYATLCSNVNYAEGVTDMVVSHEQTLKVMDVAGKMVVRIAEKLLEQRAQ